jgi:hypothetical protein
VKYPSFFEEFYIVGVDKLHLAAFNKPFEIVRPTLLYNYPNNIENKQRNEVIKDFCFPMGVTTEEVNLSKPGEDFIINDVSLPSNLILDLIQS